MTAIPSRFTCEDSGKLSHDWINSLAADDAGNLWIGTEGGGVTRWNQRDGQIRDFRHDPTDPSSLSSDRARILMIDSSSALWIGTSESGLNRLDPETLAITRFRQKPIHSNGLVDDRVRALLEDRQGRLWIGTLAGLNLYHPDQGTFERIPFEDIAQDPELETLEIRALFQDRLDNLWIGSEKGLIRFVPKHGLVQRFRHISEPGSLSHDLIRAVYEDRDGRLWVGTAGGLSLRPSPGAPFVAFESDAANPQSIGTAQVSTITEDHSGNLWFGTLADGARKWNPRALSFEHLKDDQGTEANQRNLILAISEDSRGRLWTGSLGAGIARLDRERANRTYFTHDPNTAGTLSENRVTALLHDRQDRLWAGTMTKGLNLLSPGNDSFVTYRHVEDDPRSISSDSVTSLTLDHLEQLWVGTFGSGVNHLSGDGGFERFQHREGDPDSLSSDRVFALAEGKAGQIWVATDGGGLNLIDAGSGRAHHWRFSDQERDSLSSDELYSLHVDAQGRLWIGTKNNGLDLMSAHDPTMARASFRNYSRAQGLPDATIWGIESDSLGRLWLSTNSGLVRLDPSSGNVLSYDTSHGLQSTEFNLGAHFRNNDGELFFGGVNGINAFRPEQIRQSTTPPQVALTGFKIVNQAVETDLPLAAVRSLELEHNDHFLSFEFAALDFTAPEKNLYRYQLEGFEADWVEMEHNRTISFTSLHPGNYVLRVEGSNSDGVWSQPGVAIDITVAPPLWRTWWFRTLLLVFAAATAGVAHQLRIRRIRFNNERLHALVKERTRDLEEAQERLVRKEKLAVLGELSGSVAHELRNPLGIIKNSIFFLRMTQKMVDEKAKEHLGLIDREIKRSDRIIGELLDYAKEPTAQTEAVTIREIIDATLEILKLPSSITLDLMLEDSEDGPLRIRADPGQIERVLGNLFSNAVQAMPDGGTLAVHGSRQGDDAWIRVRDTGVGIEKEDLEKIFEPLFTRKIYGIGLGLPLSLRYMQMNGGRLECESRVGEGTTFHLYLPLADAREPGAEETQDP